MLRWRLISAAVILSLLVALAWLDFQRAILGVAGAWLLPLLIVVVLLASEEMLSLLKAKGHEPSAAVVYLGNLLIALAACGPVLFEFAGKPFPNSPLGTFGWPLVALAIGAVAAFLVEMQRYRQPGRSAVQIALAIFPMVYVGVLCSFWPMLRLFRDHEWGAAALYSTLLVTKMADIGAYAVGRAIGRTKMTPILSPGKTWEGTIGGIATACVSSWAFFHFLGPRLITSAYLEPPLWATIVYGMILAVFGLIGDLAESLLKRDMQRKDSSTWLPGLGGVLDIIDAVLFAAPAAYLCWLLGLVGPGP